MSLQFFNPWIGRMNRQQFLLGAAVCGAAIYLGTSLIKQPALVVALNVFFGFMLFVFVMRRLSDQHSDDHSQKSKRFTLAKQWFEDMAPVLLYPLKAYARLSRRLRCYPYISYIFSFFVFLFLWVLAAIYKTFAFAITLVQMTLIASLLFCIFYVLMRAGNTEPNHYGRPPEGMNFWTTVPATYPDKRKAAVEKLDKLKERHQQRTSIADSKNIPSEEKK